jgi:hypothetical protein
MDRSANWITLGSFALAFGVFGAVFLLDSHNPPPQKKPLHPKGDHASNPTRTSVTPATSSTPSATEDAASTAAFEHANPVPSNGLTPAAAATEAVLGRAERRRAARALLEEFRKPSKAAPDWETTSQEALFLPDGRPVDPYMLPPLQLPASMTIESPDIEITTDTQVYEWERLQDEFIAEVGDSLPTDAASRKTWIRAQRKNDEKFRAKFGTEAFLRQQMDAYRKGFLQE